MYVSKKDIIIQNVGCNLITEGNGFKGSASTMALAA